jgi:hypothetical protein
MGSAQGAAVPGINFQVRHGLGLQVKNFPGIGRGAICGPDFKSRVSGELRPWARLEYRLG